LKKHTSPNAQASIADSEEEIKRTIDTPAGRHRPKNRVNTDSKIPKLNKNKENSGSFSKPREEVTIKTKGKYKPPRKALKKEEQKVDLQTIPIRHVSKPGYEDIFVCFHGATSLPSCNDGTDPTPFAILKTATEDRMGIMSKCTTYTTFQPTHSPCWEEAFTLQIPEKEIANDDIVLAIADDITKQLLASYKIPIKYFEPFHTYHLELVQPTDDIPHGIRLYVTIQRKLSHLNRLKEFGYCGLELTVRDFYQELTGSPGNLLAVARIVPDYTNYKDEMLTNKPFAAGVTPLKVYFPSPSKHHFERSEPSMQGFPQLSQPSTASKRPEWNYTYLFSDWDAATMFSHHAALVIEYYNASNMINHISWSVKCPVGFSVIHLDEDTLQVLTSNEGLLGVRLENLLVQQSNFKTQVGTDPMIKLILRLINTERPDTMVTTSNVESLPVLDDLIPEVNPTLVSFTPTPKQVADEYFQLPQTPPESIGGLSTFGGLSVVTPNPDKPKLLVKEDEYPPDDAIKSILPEYKLSRNLTLYNVPTNSTIPIKEKTDVSTKKYKQNGGPDNKMNNAEDTLSHREKELDRYKDAVKRMSHDIVNLRQENLTLKTNNNVLKQSQADNINNLPINVSNQEVPLDTGYVTYRINNGVVPNGQTSKQIIPELIDSDEYHPLEIDQINQKLMKDSVDIHRYKAKVQHLQNQVIKANDRETNYLKNELTRMQMIDKIEHLQKKVQKMHKLEETVLKQEKVIQKMEEVMNKYQLKEKQEKLATKKAEDDAKKNEPANEDILASLTKQNNRLHLDLQRIKENVDTEKSSLQAKLERAENRASTLEQQMVKNAREWAKEKQELTIRLQEHRNGIIRKNAS